MQDSIAKEKKWGKKMSGNFAIKGGGVGRLMANAILNFHFDYMTPSLIEDSDSDVDSLQRVSKPSTAGKTAEAEKKTVEAVDSYEIC